MVILLLAAWMIGILWGIWLMGRRNFCEDQRRAPVSGPQANSGVELVIDPDAEDGLSHENRGLSEQNVVISGCDRMTFSAAGKEQTVHFENPEENAKKYYLTFELRLYDSGGQDYEVLYTSGLVEPGKCIERIELSRRLAEGVYNAVVHVQPYRMDENKTPANNVDMRIRLIVE